MPDGAPALHEAGNAVAALLLVGANAFEEVYLAEPRPPRLLLASDLGRQEDTGALLWVDDPPLNGAAATRAAKTSLSADLVQRARGRMIANIAGVYGGDLAGGDLFAHPLAPVGGDAEQATALASLLADLDPDETKLVIREGDAATKAFVRQHEAAIRAVADALEARRTLSAADVEKIVSGLGKT